MYGWVFGRCVFTCNWGSDFGGLVYLGNVFYYANKQPHRRLSRYVTWLSIYMLIYSAPRSRTYLHLQPSTDHTPGSDRLPNAFPQKVGQRTLGGLEFVEWNEFRLVKHMVSLGLGDSLWRLIYSYM